MSKSFLDILTERVLKEHEPTRPLQEPKLPDPKSHTRELMEVQLLSQIHVRTTKKSRVEGYVPNKRSNSPHSNWSKDQAPSQKNQASDLQEKEAQRKGPSPKEPDTRRPEPKVSLTTQELLALEQFRRWGAPLPEYPLPKEIRRAYRTLALKFHPDRMTTGSDSELFHLLTQAHSLLKKWAQKAY